MINSTRRKSTSPSKEIDDSFVDMNKIIQIQNPKNVEEVKEECNISDNDLFEMTFKDPGESLTKLEFLEISVDNDRKDFNASYLEYRNSVQSS